jgi:hypothetical protein
MPIDRVFQKLGAPFALVLAASGCVSVVNKSTTKSVAPIIMGIDDVGLGCASGEATAGILSTVGNPKKGKTPHQARVLTLMSAGMCVEPLALDAELARGVALKNGEGARVNDLLEVERRYHATAARRYYAAWQELSTAWSPAPGDGCPKLNASRNEDMLYVLGLSSGVLAVLHDQAAGGEVGVPLDVPRAVARAAACLDNAQWWGVPNALQAAVWATIPGAAPEGADPLSILAESARLGDTANVRLPRAFQVQTLATLGEDAALREAIAAHAAALQTPADPRFRMLDRYAHILIRHESDKIWVSEAGHRTPGDHYGRFPGDGANLGDNDDLLDALFGPAEPDAGPTPDTTETP